MDEYIFNSRNETGGHFTQIFVQQAKREDHAYSIAGFVNASQPQTPLTATAYML